MTSYFNSNIKQNINKTELKFRSIKIWKDQNGSVSSEFCSLFYKIQTVLSISKKKSAQQSHRLHITGITAAGIAENT